MARLWGDEAPGAKSFFQAYFFISPQPKSEVVSLEFFKHDSKQMDKEETADIIYLDVQVIMSDPYRRLPCKLKV